MRGTTLLAIMAIFIALVSAVLAALARHKKAGSGNIRLIGEIGRVETRLAPEGTVVVRGELWCARTKDGSVISSQARVRVIGFEDLLALVEVCD